MNYQLTNNPVGWTQEGIEGHRKRVLGSTKPLDDFEYPNAFQGLEEPIPQEAIESYRQ